MPAGVDFLSLFVQATGLAQHIIIVGGTIIEFVLIFATFGAGIFNEDWLVLFWIVGCGIPFALGLPQNESPTTCAWIAVAVFFVITAAAILGDWNKERLPAFR